MSLLLADLEKDPRIARRRALLGAAAAGLVAVAALGVLRAARSGTDLCRGAAGRMAGVWDAPARAGVEKAFLATGKPYAGDTYRRVEKVLDERAAAWVSMYQDSCEATHVRGEQSPRLLDARTGCLERRRTELSALVALLAGGPGVEVMNGAVEAAYALPSLDACADQDALLSAVPLPSDPAAVSRIDAARATLARADAQLQTQRSRDGLETALSIEQDVRAIGYAPLLAEWLFIRGALERETGGFGAAEETFREAAVEAARAKNDTLLARIWTAEIEVIGIQRARYAEALALEAAALGAVERAGGDPSLRARLLAYVAQVLSKKGERGRALATVRSAVELLEKAPGGESPDLALVVNTQGNILLAQYKLEEARASYERALRIRTRLFGESHRAVAVSLGSVATAYQCQGEPEKALAPILRAAAITEQVLGADHTAVADVLNSQALILIDLGRYEEALQTHHRVLAIREKTLGREHPSIARTLFNMGYSLQVQGKHAEARPYLERALAMGEKLLGPKHPRIGKYRGGLGETLCEMGQLQQGEAQLRRATAIYEEAGDKDGPEMAVTLGALGKCFLHAGRPGQARAPLEQALSIANAHAGDMERAAIAEVELLLGQALWSAPADRKRALELADSARDRYAAAGGRHLKAAARADAWMKGHAPRGP